MFLGGFYDLRIIPVAIVVSPYIDSNPTKAAALAHP